MYITTIISERIYFLLQQLLNLVNILLLILVQLIYDVLTVSEATDYSPAASTVAKYRALRCHMTKLDQSSDQCQVIQNMISDSEYRLVSSGLLSDSVNLLIMSFAKASVLS